MQADRSSAARRAPWRARVAARVRCERGDTLIEVIIAALMVALIATASLGGFSDITDITQSQRAEEQATALAQQDQGRLKGLTIAQLSSNGAGTGNYTPATPVTIEGTKYTVTSSARFISGSTGTAACTGSNAADIVQTTSTVTWSGAGGQRTPVVIHGEITPTEGGSLVASAVDDLGNGVSGVTISATGPTTTTPVTTDSSGCVVFAGLETGTYTVSYTVPAGYITSSGSAPSSQTAAVTTSQTQHAPPIVLGNAGLVAATFTTTLPTGTQIASASDQMILANSQANPTTQVFGTDSSPTNNVYQSPLSTTQTVFPFDQSLGANYAYTAYAGSCTADLPTNPAPIPFYVTPGNTTNTTVPEPAMIVNVTGNTYDDAPSGSVVYTGSHWTNQSGLTTGVYAGTVSSDSTTNEYVSVTFTGSSSIYWLGTYGPAQGIATVSVDGVSKGTIDMYSSTTKYQQINSVTGLSSTGTHTLKILVSGTKNSRSSANTISVDAFNAPGVTPATTLPSTIVPNVSVLDNGSGCSANKDYPPTVADTNVNQGVLQYPGEPWIANATVCVDDGAYAASTATVNDTTVHTSPAWTGVSFTVALGAGSSGVAAGTCP
ncbi:MAG TPA: type II secretion system protein [Solirubrobacteraceae bacterium]|jgi:type II secretory pathway pseudopilin PulG